ncbi:hypothetical protein GCM10010492_03520 [Saccharothrix mutabilis subsp. mutabilis]|uniref:Uncharacterized protein n=1 Tax=Saccharothrix mutabilis subsp. mutabilis TaxID=66855 RepID=A0ABN0T161_9PSEU
MGRITSAGGNTYTYDDRELRQRHRSVRELVVHLGNHNRLSKVPPPPALPATATTRQAASPPPAQLPADPRHHQIHLGFEWPFERTHETPPGIDPDAYLAAVASHYGINLR